MVVLLLWVIALAVSILFCATTVLAARLLGGQVRAARIFLGPPVVRVKMGSVPVELGALPLPLGYVAFEPTGGEDDPARTHFHELSKDRRLAIILAPWIVVAVGCAAVLGPRAALDSIGLGFSQIILGALSPSGTGRALLERLLELSASEPVHVFGARVATKLLAYNLYPLPSLAGFALIAELLRTQGSVAPARWVTITGTILMVVIAGGWALALLSLA